MKKSLKDALLASLGLVKDINPLKHTKTMKTVVFLLQYGKLIVELEAKLHMDTLDTNGGGASGGPPK